MRILIGDKIYPVELSLDGAELNHVIELGQRTKGKFGPDLKGVNVPWIKAQFNRQIEAYNAAVTAKQPFEQSTMLGDLEFVGALIGLIWLAKKREGEEITIEAAGKTSFMNVTLLDDEPTGEPAPPPEDPDDQEQEDENAGPKGGPSAPDESSGTSTPNPQS